MRKPTNCPCSTGTWSSSHSTNHAHQANPQLYTLPTSPCVHSTHFSHCPSHRLLFASLLIQISMSVRSFTVFQDTTTEIQKINHNSDTNVVITTATDAAATLLSTLAAIEKENLHPVTGERAALVSTNAPKKRKTSVLVTKVLAPLPSSKKSKDVKSELKKLRKSSTGNGKKTDGRKKSVRGSRSTRKASPLPRVDEEQEALTATPTQRNPSRLTISQSNIDSRCYELTVSPLADVSEAYDTATETSDQESVFDKVGISFSFLFVTQLTIASGKVCQT
jgi:hypothetical protein